MSDLTSSPEYLLERVLSVARLLTVRREDVQDAADEQDHVPDVPDGSTGCENP